MEIMEYKGVKYNKERVERYALNSRTTPERFLDCVADNEVLQRLMRVDRDDNMRHYPLVSEGLYNKIGKELMDAGITEVWADGVFEGTQWDKCTLFCRAWYLDDFIRIMPHSDYTLYKPYMGYGEQVFDNGKWVSNLPEFDESLLKYGKELPDTEFLIGLRKQFQEHGINRVYCDSYFDGTNPETMYLKAECCDRDICSKITRYLDHGDEDACCAVVPSFMTQGETHVIYEGGKFYKNAN